MTSDTAGRSLVQFGYGTALFLSAAGGLIVEIVAGRLLAPYVGMSLYTWTAIIAVVLAGFSIGHWIGGRLAGPETDRVRGGRYLALALALAGLSAAGALVLLRLAAGPLLGAGLGPLPAITLLATLLFLAPSLFVGIVSPILTKLALDAAPPNAQGRVIGRMYALGAVGSIAGTIAAGFLFISWIGSTGTLLAVAGLYLLLALGFVLPRPPLKSTSLVALLAVIVSGWGLASGSFTSACDRESAYFCIRIDDASAETDRAATVMVLDHLGHGINDRDAPGLFYAPYIHFVDELAAARQQGGRLGRAFFVGGGPYTLPRAWQAPDRDVEMVVAELDPAVTRAAVEEMWLEPGPKLEIRHGDARRILQALPPEPRFDLVFGDAFKDVSIPPHLVSREFHAEIAARLMPQGFYVVNVVESRRDPVFLFALVKTLRLDFPVVEVWVEAGPQSRAARLTYVVVAGQTPSPPPPLTAAQGLPRRWLMLDPDRLARAASADHILVLTDDFAPVDRLMAHLILDAELTESR